jgi:hypothetical protein
VAGKNWAFAKDQRLAQEAIRDRIWTLDADLEGYARDPAYPETRGVKQSAL